MGPESGADAARVYIIITRRIIQQTACIREASRFFTVPAV